MLRCTVPPGTTDSMVIPDLEDASGCREGRDFDVCYNPEFPICSQVLELTKQKPSGNEGFESKIWWSWGDSNPLPFDCQSNALPIELQPQACESKRAHTGTFAPSPCCDAGRAYYSGMAIFDHDFSLAVPPVALNRAIFTATLRPASKAPTAMTTYAAQSNNCRR